MKQRTYMQTACGSVGGRNPAPPGNKTMSIMGYTHFFFCILTTKCLARWLRHRMQRLAPCAISAAPGVKMCLPLKLPSICPRNQQGPTKRGGEWLSKICRVGKNYKIVHWENIERCFTFIEIEVQILLPTSRGNQITQWPCFRHYHHEIAPLICKAQSFGQQNGCTYLSKLNGDIVHLRFYCVYS